MLPDLLPRLRRAPLPSATSASCAARRIPRSWSSARAALGYARARDHRRVLARRRRARARRGEGRRAARSSSAASSRSTDGARSSCCSRTDRASYGNLVAADHAWRAAAPRRAATRASRGDVAAQGAERASRSPACRSAWPCSCPRRRSGFEDELRARAVADDLVPGPRCDRRRAAAPRRRRRRWLDARRRASPRARGLPHRRRRRRATCTCARGSRCRTRSPRSGCGTPVAECGFALAAQRRAAPALARAAWRRSIRAELLAQHARARAALPLLARRAALRVSGGDRAARARRRPRTCASSTDAGLARRYGRDGAARRRPRADRARARADRRAAATSPTSSPSHDIVALRARAGHPLPGPRLAPPTRPSATASASPRSIPSRMTLLFERFISERAQRAARHRRRLRAPAARGGDPVHLRQVRPRPRRARRDGHHATGRAQRGARRRQGARPRPRAGRPARAASFAWWDGRDIDARAPPRSRLRSRQPADRAARSTLDRRADRLSAPPVAARRRLRHRARAARRAWCRSRTRRWRTAPSSSGTRTTSTRWACSRSTASRSAC